MLTKYWKVTHHVHIFCCADFLETPIRFINNKNNNYNNGNYTNNNNNNNNGNTHMNYNTQISSKIATGVGYGV